MTITPDSSIHTVPALTQPAAGASYVDPVYGSTIVRLTDSAHAPDNARGYGFLNTIRPEYSSVCPWSLGNNWLILQHGSYFGLYTGAGVYVSDLPFTIAASSEPRWSRTNNNLLYFHTVYGNALLSYNVVTHVTTTLHTFSEYSEITGGGEMDTPTTTGLGIQDFLVYTGDGTEAFVYSVLPGIKSQVVPISAPFDSLYLAPDATRFTITEAGVINEYLTSTGAALSPTPLCQSGSHMDVAPFGGNQYLVRTNSDDASPLAGYPNAIELVNLAGGAQTGLLSLPWSEAVHVSASDVGVAVVETYAAIGTAWDVYMDEILLISLDGSTTRRVAQHRSAVADYNSMPLTTVRRDGKAAVFASNWGNSTGPMDTYLLLLGIPSPATGRISLIGRHPTIIVTSPPSPPTGSLALVGHQPTVSVSVPPAPPPTSDVDKYLSLLTSQWRPPNAPKMNTWLAANLQLFQDVIVCAQEFVAAFDPTIASGPQLDILGNIVGQPRQVNFQPSGGVSPILDDATYALLIQATIAKNHWDGKIDSLVAIWKALFPGGTLTVVDNQDMTVDLFVAGAFTSILQDLILQGYILPRPQGVLAIYHLAALPMLGFDANSTWLGGFDQGKFV